MSSNGGGGAGMMAAMAGSQALASLSTAYSQTQAIRMRGDFEKQMADINAAEGNLAASDAIKRGDTAARMHMTKVREIIGAQRAGYAGQGVDVNSGSAKDVQVSTAGMGALDAQTIRNNAFREAMGYKIQALDYTAKGEFARIGAKFDSTQTLLTGGMRALGYSAQSQYWLSQNGGGGGGGGNDSPVGINGGWSGNGSEYAGYA